jgi:hypothetical protein
MSPTRRNLVKTTIYVEKSVLASLKKFSAETLIPQAVLIRKGIELALKQYRPRQKK